MKSLSGFVAAFFAALALFAFCRRLYELSDWPAKEIDVHTGHASRVAGEVVLK